MDTENKNLMQGLCEEIDRVKDIVKVYEGIPGRAGLLAAQFMKKDIADAEKARNIGDIMEMIKSYKKLQDYKL